MILCRNHIYKAGALLAIVFVVLVLLSLSARAQDWNDDEDEPRAVRIRERINQLKKARLIETLNFDETTAEKFFVRYNQAQRNIDSAQQALKETLKQLQRAVRQQKKSRIKELTDESLKRHADLQNAIAAMLTDMRPLLDETQYAKFILFEARFQEEVRRRLMEIKRRGRKQQDRREEHDE